MKKIALFFAAILPMMAMAQEIKIGYVSTQEVMMLMPEINDIEKQMADFNEKNTKYLQDMQVEIQNKAKAYDAEKANLSDAIRAAIETVGQKNNFFMIFESEAGLLYKSPKAVDATPLIKKELGIL